MSGPSDAPPSFVAPSGGDAVFVHLVRARHRITLDPGRGVAFATTELRLRADRSGHPVLLCPPASVAGALLDGLPVDLPLVEPAPGSAPLRVCDRFVEPGHHVLELGTDLLATRGADGTAPVRFGVRGVELAFPMSDAVDDGFLEQYLPTNLEFDVHDLDLELVLTGIGERHLVITNGALTIGPHGAHEAAFRITQSRVRSSSLFLHVAPASALVTRAFEVTVPAGRPVPVLAYTRAHDVRRRSGPPSLDPDDVTRVDLADFERWVTFALAEHLVDDLGPYPEPGLIVYARPEASGRGMEYKGAVEATQDALLHELVHLWWGRYLSPTGGRDGWIDEAIATWYGKGVLDVEWPPFGQVDLRGRDPYRRSTPPDAYDEGAILVGYLHHLAKVRHRHGLLRILRDIRPRLRETLSSDALLALVVDVLAPPCAGQPPAVDARWIVDILDQHVRGASPYELPPRRRQELLRAQAPPELAVAARKRGAPWLTRAVYAWATDGLVARARRWPDHHEQPPWADPTVTDPADPAFVNAPAVQFVEYLHYLLYVLPKPPDGVPLLGLLRSSEVDWDTLSPAFLRGLLDNVGLLTLRMDEAFERYAIARAPRISARGFSRKIHRVFPPEPEPEPEPELPPPPPSAPSDRLLALDDALAPALTARARSARLGASAERRAADGRGLSFDARLRHHQQHAASASAADVLRRRNLQPGEIGTWFSGGPPKHWGINFAFTRPANSGDTAVYYVYGEVPSYEYYDAHAPTPWQWRQYVPEQAGLTFDAALDLGGQIWLTDRGAVGLGSTKITLYVRTLWYSSPLTSVPPRTYG